MGCLNTPEVAEPRHRCLSTPPVPHAGGAGGVAMLGPMADSIKDRELYEALREDAASQEKAARIANAELIEALRNH